MVSALELHPQLPMDQILRNETHHHGSAVTEVRIGSRRRAVTPVFDTFWRFAAERNAVYLARLRNEPGPWTSDSIIATHRFTNCYRASDRVSQYLIHAVIYDGPQDPTEIVFRTLLFKFFNKISTWELLTSELGEVTWSTFDEATYDGVLSRHIAGNQRLYSAAYVIPPPQFGAQRKHTNHLRLLQHMIASGIVEQLAHAASMQDAFEALRSYPGMGDFLAYQFLIDLNYSDLLDFDEMDFVVAGPGARDGIRKCFGDFAKGTEHEFIRYMCDAQEFHFDRLGLKFEGLGGRRLQLIDCQNLFCEVDKYARVAHPHVAGFSGRSRIKQKFRQDPRPVAAWFPPKWGVNHRFSETTRPPTDGLPEA